jgi:uncharacterized ferritin-like protein (DUF455 family)
MSAGRPPVLDPGPFTLCVPGTRPPRPRRPGTPEGLGDRLRTAAFAEWQAITAFRWAAEHFADAPEQLRADWRSQVADEARHYRLIIDRMRALGIDPAGRPVSDSLWASLRQCATGREFCVRIASAEERGRVAALRLIEFLAGSDPETAAVFREIADDEVAHVSLATTYYGWSPGSP